MGSYTNNATPAKATDRTAWTSTKTIGDAGEQLVTALLRGLGFNVAESDGTRSEPHDLEVSGQLEVKHDRQAAATGNVAVELSYRGIPSGLSVSQAATWVFVLGNGEILLCRAEALRELVRKTSTRVRAGDDGQSVCALVPLQALRRIARRIVRAAA